MYLVRSLGEATGVTAPGAVTKMSTGKVYRVHESAIESFRGNPAAFTILGGTDEVTALGIVAAEQASGTSGDVGVLVDTVLTPASGCAAADQGAVIHRTTISLDGVEVAVADTGAFGYTGLFAFPAGRILILGVVCGVRWAVTSDRDTTINVDASLTWALGSAPASNKTLATTMVDLTPKTAVTLAALAALLNDASSPALASSAQFASGLEVYLNAGFETDTEIDADGTLEATGAITITWMNLG